MTIAHASDCFQTDAPTGVSAWCVACHELGQYTLAAPGRDLCPYHVRVGKPAQTAVEPLGPVPAQRQAQAAQGAPGRVRASHGAKFGLSPRRRRSATAARPDGRFAPPHAVAVVCALPPGSRRAHGQVDALAALDQVEELLQLRADRQATMAAVWRALVYAAEHETRTVTTTWAHLEAAAGCSRSTVARCLRWLRDVGLVGVVHTGASSAALGTDVNRAPTYVLAVPVRLDPVDEIDTPPGPFRSVRSPRTRASDAGELEPQGPALRLAEDPKSAPKAGRRPTWALSDLPVRSSERLAAAEALRWDAVTLRPITARMLRHILRPWFDAGWSPRDVLYALDHRPDGAAWTYAGLPRSPAAWVRWRLGAWAGPGGAPMPSRGQVARARAGVRARA